MTTDDERLQRVLGGEALSALRSRLRAAYERLPEGAVPVPMRLSGLAPDEREALAALGGRRPREAGSIRIDPAAVSARLAAAGLASDLRSALERLDGPIRPVTAERTAQAAAWAAVAAGEADPRLRAWLQGSSNLGLLKRLAVGDAAAAGRLLARVGAVLAVLPAAGAPRARLAAEVLGDAHALDDGQPTATLALAVLRRPRSPDDDDPEGRRAEWASVGISVNELARPVLTLNLDAASGEPAYRSLRQLLRSSAPVAAAAAEVFVCENPNVVAIAADALGVRCAPLVCTDGMPAAAQRALLAALATAGAHLRYHGDFDWPGVAIANLVLRDFGAKPWRMAAQDYLDGLRAPAEHTEALAGAEVAPSWSVELHEAMRRLHRTLPEEAVADALLADLAR